MTSTPPSPGRTLPAAIYWRRRLFVAGVLVALVLIAVNSVRGGADPGADVQARSASADQVEQSAGAGGDEPTTGPAVEPGKKGKKGKKGKRRGTTSADPGPTVALPTAPVLIEPEGECADDDIAVTPAVEDAVAGRSATIVLKLRTITAAACTWLVSADSLAVKISVGGDDVWSTRECTEQLPTRAVVVRQAVTSTYELTWNTRRSDDSCSELTEYAQPGDYRVSAAALGGEPADLVFDLAAPTAPEPDPVPDFEKMPEKKGKQSVGG